MSGKILTRVGYAVLAAVFALALAQAASAVGSIDAVNKWAWGTNVGWLNFNPAAEGVSVCGDHLEGYAWAENLGWLRLGTFTGCGAHTYANNSTVDYGVNRASSGQLTGYAWSANAGWIKFDPANGGVTIDPATGSFDGYAWGENVGWIHFKGTGAFPYNVVTQLGKLLLPLIQR